MEIFRSLQDAAQRNASDSRAAVVTIGSFDGIHVAHQELLRRVRTIANEMDAVSAAVTFDPHPLRVLAPQRAPKLLTPLPVKLDLFAASGIDRLVIVPFTLELSQWMPEKFVQEVLVKTLHAAVVLIGANFRFGHNQAGTPEAMQELGRRYGFRTEILPTLSLRNMTISSSQIRRLLEQGSVAPANRLLGRSFNIRNIVESGLGIGRKETVPTLNLGRYSEQLPAAGVYVTWTKVWEKSGDGNPSRLLRSVTNVGRRPTFGERDLGVETHLLESWDGPSPAEMEVSFLCRLRDERKFDSPQELKAQIMKDIRRAQNYFRRLERFGVEPAK